MIYSSSNPKEKVSLSSLWKVANPRGHRTEDTKLTKSFHDRVGVQDALLDPLCNLVALPGCR